MKPETLAARNNFCYSLYLKSKQLDGFFFLHSYCLYLVVIWVVNTILDVCLKKKRKNHTRGKTNCHSDFKHFHSQFQWAWYPHCAWLKLQFPSTNHTWNTLNGYRSFILSSDDLQWPNLTKKHTKISIWQWHGNTLHIQ